MRRDSEESKTEGSIPVQSRVNIKNLANLDLYWESERYHIRTMSQLIGFSMELLCEILESNGKIINKIETVAEANQYLNERGLYQQSMKDRSFKKIGMAIAFENMREEGADPKFHASEQYHRVHRKVDTHGNPSAVQPFTGRVRNQRVSQEMIDLYNNLKPEDVKPLVSQEFAMRNVEILDELPTMEQGADMSDRFKTIEEQDKAQEEALKNLDTSALMASAKKESPLND
jgi:hypothetical protein